MAMREPCLSLRQRQLHLVDVAPAPVFSWLEGAHDGVFRLMEMFGGVFIFGGIAAADVAALQTEPKMNPGVAHL